MIRGIGRMSPRTGAIAVREAGIACLCGLVAGPAIAQTPPFEADSSYARSSLIQPRDWVLGAVFLGSGALIQIPGLDDVDDAIKPDSARRNAFYRQAPRQLGRVTIGAALSVGTILVGEIAGSRVVSDVGVRSLEALALGATMATVLKVSVGRARPDSGMEEDTFSPFAFSSDHWSYPSGHTVNAFALATIVSSELGDEAPWVPFVAYPVAAWTGVSRMLDSRHWFTDVMAGASVGIFSGLLIERLHGSGAPTDGRPGLSPRLLLSAGDPLVLGVGFPIQ